MTKGGRDDFARPVRRVLSYRAGHRCSNPACRRVTCKADPGSPDNYIELGIGAHITAASPGGPRYDAALSSQARAAASNGIWLCSKCAREIDLALSTYTVELLREWKSSGEFTVARDAASTRDEIEVVVAAIDRATDTIREIAAIATTDFDGDWETDWTSRVQRLMQLSLTRQREYDAHVSALVVDLRTKASTILGTSDVAVDNVGRVAQYARTNALCMLEMADALEALRSTLLLR